MRWRSPRPASQTAALHAVDRLDLDDYLYYHSTRGELLRRLGRESGGSRGLPPSPGPGDLDP